MKREYAHYRRDPAILRRIIAHNETHAAFCAAG